MRALKLVVTLALSAGVLAAPVVVRADIVTNGTFTGTSGWTTGSASGNFPWFIGNGYASTGCVGNPCINGTPAQQASLYQILPTMAGDTYTLSFQYQGAGSPDELKVFFGSIVADYLINVNTATLMTYTVSGLVASSNATKLMFLGRQDPGFNLLEDVTVNDDGPVPSPVPEPGTVGLVGTGFLTLMGFARRRVRGSDRAASESVNDVVSA